MRVKDGPDPATDDRVAQLETLYHVEYDGMVRLAYTLLGSSAEAEEVVQDGFVEVHRRWEHIQKPGAYLRSAVVSRCRSALRRRQLLPRSVDAPSVSASAGDLWDVLSHLPVDQRTVVVLRYYGGYTASDIAVMLEMPASTVRSHLRRGLAALKKELEG